MIIETPEDWWEALEANWHPIVDIYERCGADLESKMWRDDISAPIEEHEKSLKDTLESHLHDKDHEKMIGMLNLCWSAAPDQPHIHAWPCWGLLCDLCSEAWVFYEEADA